MKRKLCLLRTTLSFLAKWLFSRITFILFRCRILLLLRNNPSIQSLQKFCICISSFLILFLPNSTLHKSAVVSAPDKLQPLDCFHFLWNKTKRNFLETLIQIFSQNFYATCHPALQPEDLQLLANENLKNYVKCDLSLPNKSLPRNAMKIIL